MNQQNNQLSYTWLFVAIDKAPHWYRRGLGFNIRAGLNFFFWLCVRACLHGGGGLQVDEVTRLAVVEK